METDTTSTPWAHAADTSRRPDWMTVTGAAAFGLVVGILAAVLTMMEPATATPAPVEVADPVVIEQTTVGQQCPSSWKLAVNAGEQVCVNNDQPARQVGEPASVTGSAGVGR